MFHGKIRRSGGWVGFARGFGSREITGIKTQGERGKMEPMMEQAGEMSGTQISLIVAGARPGDASLAGYETNRRPGVVGLGPPWQEPPTIHGDGPDRGEPLLTNHWFHGGLNE